jgi:hypothetical protein
MAVKDNKNGGDLGFEAEMFKAWLGLIFFEYISDAF